jgi:hypothetical protein
MEATLDGSDGLADWLDNGNSVPNNLFLAFLHIQIIRTRQTINGGAEAACSPQGSSGNVAEMIDIIMDVCHCTRLTLYI